jgi:hypothetical protein
MHGRPLGLRTEGLERPRLTPTSCGELALAERPDPHDDRGTIATDRNHARKRATGRPNDAASLPALEATLRTRRG